MHNEKSICWRHLRTICSSNNSLLPKAECSNVLLLRTSLCKLISTLQFFPLLILLHTSSFTWGLSPPPLAHLIGRWAQSSVFHNEIPGGEKNNVKSRGGQQKGGEEFRVDGLSDLLR